MAFANYNFGLVGFSQKTAKSFENLGMNVAYHIYSNDKKKNIACNHAFSWLKEHKINCLVYSNVPHQGIAIAQYAIAKELGIKILIFNQTLFAGKTWLVDDWKDLGYFNSSASGKGFPVM